MEREELNIEEHKAAEAIAYAKEIVKWGESVVAECSGFTAEQIEGLTEDEK